MKLPASINPYLFEQFSWKLKYIDICPLWRCNAKCPTCGAWKRDTPDLSMAQAINIVEYFKGLDRIVIEGGEPTMWKPLKYFVNNIDAKHVMIISNGFLHDRIKKYNFDTNKVHWLISLNGIREMHDLSRGVKGAYGKTLTSILNLKRAGYEVIVSYVAFKQNIDHYEKVKELCKDLGCVMNLCFPVGNVKFGEYMKWDMLPYDEITDLQNRHYTNLRFLNKWTKKRFIKNVEKRKIMKCLAGKSMAHINPEGTIRPCCWDESMVIGTVGNHSVTISDFMRKQYHSKGGRIPNKCQYQTGTLCGDCFVHYSLRKSLII